MSELKLVIFDCDGTLVDSQGVIHAAMTRTFTDAGLEAPALEAVRRIIGLHLIEAIGRLAPGRSRTELEALERSYKEHFLALRQSPDYFEPLFDGVKDVLQGLDGAGYLIGMATGKSRRGVEAVLTSHGLKEYFAVTKSADDGPGKPHPQILEDALAETGVRPENAVILGDTSFDILLGKNAGVTPVGVSWGYHPVEELRASGAAAVLDSLYEVPGWLVRHWNGDGGSGAQ